MLDAPGGASAGELKPGRLPSGDPQVDLLGTGLVLVSATALATSAVLVKIAYRVGLSLDQVLSLRFLLSTPLLAAAMLLLHQHVTQLGRRRIIVLFLMGAAGYASQTFAFYAALRTLPASLVALVAYIYPALVAVGSWLLFGQRIGLRHGIALGASFLGIVLLVGARLEWSTGIALALITPVIYAAYILTGDRVMRGTPALPATAVVIFGAAVTWTLIWALHGSMELPSQTGWLVVLAIALIPTLAGILLFLAGLRRIGGARTALLSSSEPVITVALAALFLGDRLTGVQVAGGALVVAAVLLLQWPVEQYLGRLLR
jgi:drug/metabolite transporter (DMT)-like permease